MDLRSLRYFVSAVDEGSISGASKLCHVAQPSITLAIGKLEDKFNTPLLKRHAKGVSPTDKGLELYTMARDLLNHAQAIESQIKAPMSTTACCVAINKSIQVRYVEHIIKAAKQLSTQIELELIDDPSNADLYITTQSRTPKGWLFSPITVEQYCLLIPPAHPLAFKDSIELSDLTHQSIIERIHCENQSLFDQVTQQLNLEMHTVAKVDNEEWGLALVASGLGLCLSPLPKSYQDTRFKAIPLSSMMGASAPTRQIGLSWKARHHSEKDHVLQQLVSRFSPNQSSDQINASQPEGEHNA